MGPRLGERFAPSGVQHALMRLLGQIVKLYEAAARTNPEAASLIRRGRLGGFRQSGIYRDKSLHAPEKYTKLKATRIQVSG